MSELGRLLAEARTARELSLADVEAATRIRQKYLAALENGQFSALPHGPVARGFLRAYARYLGLDESDTLLKYAQESGDAGDQIAVAEPGKPRLIDYRPVEVALTDGRPRLGWLRWVLALVVIAALGGGGWWLLSRAPGWNPFSAFGPAPRATATTAAARPTELPTLSTSGQLSPTPPPPPTVQVTPLPTSTSDLLPLPTPTVPPTLTPTPRATATPEVTRISITARITQRAWLRATVDGKVVMEENLEAGQVRTWEAEKSLALLTGNAGGVILTINNQEAGAMGALVQVVERTWVIQDGQIIEIAPGTATPTPRPTLTPTPTG